MEDKKFEMVGDKLHVTVSSGDKLWLPQKDAPEGKGYIGKYTQVTIQEIDKDKAHILRDFIVGEKKKGDEQAIGIAEKLEELKDFNVEELDADLVKAVKETIMKGSKQRRENLTALNTHIGKVAMKRQLLTQSEFIANELKRINKELSDLDKALE